MDKKDFWSSLPAIQTGITAMLGVGTVLYLAGCTGPAQPGSGAAFVVPPAATTDGEAPATTAVSQWPLLVREPFSKSKAEWPLGNYPEGALRRFELSMTGGSYRWELDAGKELSKSVNAPFGFLTNFFAAIDVTVREHSVDPIDVGLMFGKSGDVDFRLLLKSPGLAGVSRSVGTTSTDMVVAWVPVNAPDGQPNRIAVLFDDGEMAFYVNDKPIGTYSDARSHGGGLGLSVGAYSAGTAVIEFDNFELRRKP